MNNFDLMVGTGTDKFYGCFMETLPTFKFSTVYGTESTAKTLGPFNATCTTTTPSTSITYNHFEI